ncbi:MAG: LysR family transcriptional regulator [Rhodospirillales bacterium]
MDRFAAMQAFVAVAEAGGFAPAARRLGIVPSVVTKRIGQLETWLGVRLLARTTRNVRLTEEGALYLASCTRILAEMADAEAAVVGARVEPAGLLRLSAPTSLGIVRVAPVLFQLQDRYPRLTVELVLLDRVVDPLEEGFDAAIRDQSGAPDQHLRVVRLAQQHRLVYASPSYISRRGEPANPQQLVDHDCIHYSFLASGRRWVFSVPGEAAEGGITVTVRPCFTTNNGRVMLDAAVAGRGIALLPAFLAEDLLAAGRLVRLLAGFPVPPDWITLVHAPAAALTGRLRLLVTALRRHFAGA